MAWELGSYRMQGNSIEREGGREGGNNKHFERAGAFGCAVVGGGRMAWQLGRYRMQGTPLTGREGGWQLKAP